MGIKSGINLGFVDWVIKPRNKFQKINIPKKGFSMSDGHIIGTFASFMMAKQQNNIYTTRTNLQP